MTDSFDYQSPSLAPQQVTNQDATYPHQATVLWDHRCAAGLGLVAAALSAVVPLVGLTPLVPPAGAVTITTSRLDIDEFLDSYEQKTVNATVCNQVLNYTTGWRGVGPVITVTASAVIKKLTPDMVVPLNVDLGEYTGPDAYREKRVSVQRRMAIAWANKGRECKGVVDPGGPSHYYPPGISENSGDNDGQKNPKITVTSRLSSMFFSS